MLPRRVAELDRCLAARAPLFGGLVGRGHELFGPSWADQLDELVEAVLSGPGRLEAAVAGYSAFALDIMRRQLRFEEERCYPEKSYEEAAREVYLNESYMTSEYLPGLLLSQYLWPHHFRQLRFFDTAFVPRIGCGAEGFVEVGVGTGTYSRWALQRRPALSGVGIDVSPAVRSFAESHLGAYGLADRYEIRLQDVMLEPIEPSRWLICVEVLEHLEDPRSLLKAIREALVPGGAAFVTAALNAPNADHVYLYERPDDVLEQLAGAGLDLEEMFMATAYPPRRPGFPVPSVAAFVVS